MATYKDIGVELTGHVGLIEIRRPPNNFFDNSLINQIGMALEAYQDLQRAWNTTRGLLAAPVIGYEPQRTLIVKYGIPIDRRGDMPLMDFKGAVFAIFKAAREHIDRTSALLRR